MKTKAKHSKIYQLHTQFNLNWHCVGTYSKMGMYSSFFPPWTWTQGPRRCTLSQLDQWQLGLKILEDALPLIQEPSSGGAQDLA